MIDGGDIAYKIVLRWISLDLSDDKSTLVQVMAWCRQAELIIIPQSWFDAGGRKVNSQY